MAEKEKKQSVQTIQTKTRVEKGKSGIASVIFGRTGIIILLILLQFGFLIAGYTYLQGKMYFIDSVVKVGAVILVIYLTNNRSNPAFKMVWMTIMLVAPVFGVLLYIFVEFQVGVRWLNARLEHMHETTKKHWTQDEAVQEQLKEEDSEVASLAHYVCEYGGFPAYENTGVKYFSCGEDKIEELIRQLEKAEKFIFMEYFIVTKSYMWNTILEILKEKAAQGVEVRMMYDGMCSLALLPYGYYKDLEKMGIQSIPFSQIRPVLSTYQNNRDHRKILIIDGKTVFTGGINLADEYINRIDRFGHWKDTAVMIQGEAVKSFTLLFLKMWHVAKGKDSIPQEEIRKYTVEVWENTQSDEMRTDMESMRNTDMQNTQDKKLHAGGYVIPYGDDPYGDERIGKQVYIDILNRARKYVHIMTPYLILDDEMITALRYCAKRGVETVIIMPHIPDKIYAYLLARTYYKQLLKYGVKIYEYTPGFVHAKVFVSDDIRGCVGTINLDFRSLYLHFECGAYMYSNDVLHDVEQDFKETLKQCQEITKESCDKYPKGKMLVGKMLRLIAPLM